MRIGITFKIVFLVVSPVIASALAVLIAGRMAFEDGFSKEYDANIVAFAKVGAYRIPLAGAAKAQAVRPNVVAGLASCNDALLARPGCPVARVSTAGGGKGSSGAFFRAF